MEQKRRVEERRLNSEVHDSIIIKSNVCHTYSTSHPPLPLTLSLSVPVC
jgi:hypothetical protein